MMIVINMPTTRTAIGIMTNELAVPMKFRNTCQKNTQSHRSETFILSTPFYRFPNHQNRIEEAEAEREFDEKRQRVMIAEQPHKRIPYDRRQANTTFKRNRAMNDTVTGTMIAIPSAIAIACGLAFIAAPLSIPSPAATSTPKSQAAGRRQARLGFRRASHS